LFINNIIELSILSIKDFLFIVVLLVIFILIINIIIPLIGINALVFLSVWLIIVIQLLKNVLNLAFELLV
jgi:hypothetical protein